MSRLELIKEGIGHVHRNWQLLLVQLAWSFINLAGLVVFVALPLVVAAIVIGLDPSELSRLKELAGKAGNPLELLLEYLGLILVFVTGLLFYFLFVFSVWLFIFGGSAGVLAGSVRQEAGGFSMKSFMAHGRRLFLPLLWYTSLVGLALLGIMALFALLFVAASALAGMLGLEDGRGGLFFKTLFVLSFVAACVLLPSGILMVSLQGLAPLVMRGLGAGKSFREAFDYLGRAPGALGLMAILVLGYLGAQVLLFSIGYPLQLLPVVGFVLSLPVQVFSSVAQGYVCLVVLATVFAGYRPLEVQSRTAFLRGEAGAAGAGVTGADTIGNNSIQP
jgi:hypothetical protein